MPTFFISLRPQSSVEDVGKRRNQMTNMELEQAVSPELEVLGFECVKLEVVGATRNPVVRLYIDKPGGVSIKDCALASRTVGLILDRLDPFPGRYLLEVSSPGSNRPLTREEHFNRFAGHAVKVQSSGNTYTGVIVSCSGGVVTLSTRDGELSIRLEDIVRANLTAEVYEINKKKTDKKRKRSKRNKGDK